MVDKNINIRIGVAGGDQTKKDLSSIGAVGKAALDGIAKATGPVGTALAKLKEFGGGFLQGFGAEFQKTSGVLGSLGVGAPLIIGATAGLAAVGVAIAAVGIAAKKSFTFVADVTREAIDHFDNVTDSAERLGVSAEAFQTLTFGFEGAGLKAAGLETSLTKLNDALGTVMLQGENAPKQTVAAFERLGISLDDIAAAGGSVEKILPQIADGLASVGTHAEQVALMRDLFGKAGGAMLPGITQMAGFRAELEKFGGPLSNAAVKVLGDAKDKMVQLGHVSSILGGRIGQGFAQFFVAFKEAQTTVFAAVASKIEEATKTEGFQRFAETVNGLMGRAAAGVVMAIDQIIAKAGGIDAVFRKIEAAIGTFVNALIGGDGASVSVEQFAEAAVRWINHAKDAFSGLLTIINTIASGINLLMRINDIKIPNFGAIAGTAVHDAAVSAADWAKRQVGFQSSSPAVSAPGVAPPSSPPSPNSNQPPSPGEAAQLAPRPQGPAHPVFSRDAPRVEGPRVAPAVPSVKTPASFAGPFEHKVGANLNIDVRAKNAEAKVKARSDPGVKIQMNQGLNAGMP